MCSSDLCISQSSYEVSELTELLFCKVCLLGLLFKLSVGEREGVAEMSAAQHETPGR